MFPGFAFKWIMRRCCILVVVFMCLSLRLLFALSLNIHQRRWFFFALSLNIHQKMVFFFWIVSMAFCQILRSFTGSLDWILWYLKKFFFNSYLTALGLSCCTQDLHYGMWDLVPRPGIKPSIPALGEWSLSYCTTKGVCFKKFFLKYTI